MKFLGSAAGQVSDGRTVTHPVDVLWAAHHPQIYPPGVIGVPKRIPGLAFFPGGSGLWGSSSKEKLPSFPIGGLMILGHDFHSEAGYNASVERGHESLNQPTWRNLLQMLERGGIPLKQCFFTNYYMGLRKGSATTGKFPGANNATFEAHCGDFFLKQVNALRPKAILTLGKYVPTRIARFSQELSGWEDAWGFREIDRVGALHSGCRFPGVTGVLVGALIHPSMRYGSLRYRNYRQSTGADAEVAIINAVSKELNRSPIKRSFSQ